MSRSSSQISPISNAPLLKSRGQLEARSEFVTSELAKLLEAPAASLQFRPEFASNTAVAELQGALTEPTQGRNRGRATQVVKLCDFGSCGQAWIGVRERWDFAEYRGGKPFYAFESAGITVFAGAAGQLDKAQILRSEWAGFANRGNGPSFQAGGAGHPHWQIDLFETLRDPDRDVVRFGEQPTIRPFTASGPTIGLKERLQLAPFERFHFASAARWWRPETEVCHHQHAPNDDHDISRWVLGTVTYVREQLEVVARGLSRAD